MLTPAWISVANCRENTWSDFGLTLPKLTRLLDAAFCSASERASRPRWRS